MQPAPTDHDLRDHRGPGLLLVPGQVVALFIVSVGLACSLLAVPAARWLEGLKAARDLLGFAELHRFDDAPLDELLPWAGNV